MNILILLLSVIIYASFGPINLLYILFSSITSFLTAKYTKDKNRKLIFGITIVINLAILVFFKVGTYFGLFGISAENIIAPIGISYYTLQIISYLVDVCKKKYEPQKSLVKYLMYVIYIPYLIIGPINRYDDISKSLYEKKHWDTNRILNGIIRVCWGLFKKYLIDGRIAMIISVITENTAEFTGAYALFAMLLYSIEIYSDFSGGIDMVIGVSKMFGIEVKENFDSPYLSENLKEFWRRWHIGLSSWLRDYVYIPLGGNRKGTFRTKLNLIITFVVSGLWHGANYILWGLFHGILVCVSKFLTTKSKTLNRIINYLIVSILWAFFIWPSTMTALSMIGSIFTTFNYPSLFTNLLNFNLDLANIIILIISTIMLIIFDAKKDKIISKIKNMKIETKILLIGILIIIVLVFGIYGIGFNVNEFIYSKF